jgi:hypothetical protein
MTIQLPPLPELLRVACEAGGMEAVQALSDAFGGKQMTLPRRCGDDHPLVQVAGREVADAICVRFGGSGQIEFPRGVKALRMWLAADALINQGATLNRLVSLLHVSHREARRLKKKIAQGGAAVTDASSPRARKRDPRQIDIEDFTGPTSRKGR